MTTTARNCRRLMILPVAILLLGPEPAQAVDQVTRRSERAPIRGEFTDMSVASITIKQSNGELKQIPVSDILTVRFDDEPLLLAQARSNELSGALEAALQRYREILKEYNGSDRRLVSELEFLIARTQVKMALADPANREAAVSAIQKFRATGRTNFRYLEATLLEAQILAADPASADAARTLLQEVEASPVTGFQLQAGVQLGRLLLSSGDAAGAQALFEKVARQSLDDPGARNAHFDALLGQAMCQQRQGQLEAAIATLDEVIRKAGESQTQTLAEAWVLKGDCFRQRNLPKDALWSYLTVDVLYASEPAAHAESLYHLASLWGPTGHQDRADDARQRLIERYPNSPWAKQAPAAPVP